MWTKFSMCFAAGAFGGLAEVIWAWLIGRLGITAALGVKFAMKLTPDNIYRPVVWGGLWALFFLLPILSRNIYLKGIVISILPTIAAIFIFAPLRMKAASTGGFVYWNAITGMGFMPIVVIVNNAIWGATAALWLKVTNFM